MPLSCATASKNSLFSGQPIVGSGGQEASLSTFMQQFQIWLFSDADWTSFTPKLLDWQLTAHQTGPVLVIFRIADVHAIDWQSGEKRL